MEAGCGGHLAPKSRLSRHLPPIFRLVLTNAIARCLAPFGQVRRVYLRSYNQTEHVTGLVCGSRGVVEPVVVPEERGETRERPNATPAGALSHEPSQRSIDVIVPVDLVVPVGLYCTEKLQKILQ